MRVQTDASKDRRHDLEERVEMALSCRLRPAGAIWNGDKQRWLPAALARIHP